MKGMPPAKSGKKDPAVIRFVVENLRLSLELFRSSEISRTRKLVVLAIGVAWFIFSPLGIWNDFIAGLGIPDDIGFVIALSWVFNETCPKAIVNQIRSRLGFD